MGGLEQRQKCDRGISFADLRIGTLASFSPNAGALIANLR
jgi:hypothetical protein